MQCRELIGAEPFFAEQEIDVTRIARVMRDRNIGMLPIVSNRKPVGTITDRDLAIRVLGENRGADTPAREVMTENPITCKLDEELEAALNRIQESGAARILCINDKGELQGVISVADVAVCGLRVLAAHTFEVISGREVRQEAAADPMPGA